MATSTIDISASTVPPAKLVKTEVENRSLEKGKVD